MLLSWHIQYTCSVPHKYDLCGAFIEPTTSRLSYYSWMIEAGMMLRTLRLSLCFNPECQAFLKQGLLSQVRWKWLFHDICLGSEIEDNPSIFSANLILCIPFNEINLKKWIGKCFEDMCSKRRVERISRLFQYYFVLRLGLLVIQFSHYFNKIPPLSSGILVHPFLVGLGSTRTIYHAPLL